MVHGRAPNGLLVIAEIRPDCPCGVPWTSDPSEATRWETPEAALAWADANAPALAKALRVGIADPGTHWNGDAVRLTPAAPPSPCPRCHGSGTLTEDPLPGCPAGPSMYEARECPACEGTGEVAA